MGRKVVKVVNDKNIKHAVLWIRVSSREQKEGYSLDAQEDRVKNYCIRKGLTVIKQFTIVESSTRGERKEFYNMINFIKKYKDPVALVCDKVDRLQRSFKEYNVLNELIEKEKMVIHFQTEQAIMAKNAKAHDKMMWNFRVTVAQSQTVTMSDNVIRSFEKMRKEGKWAHHAPVGYKNVRDANGKANHKVQKHEYVFKGLVRCKNCGGVVSTDINVHSAKKKGGEKIVYKYLFCPQCGGYRTREENGVEKVREALKTLKNMPKSVVEKLVAWLDEEIYKDHKMEIEAKKALDRQIAGFAEKESRLIDLFTGGSITQDLYTKKLTEYRQDKKKLEERLTDYSHLTKQGLITLKYLAGLLLMSDQIWNFLNNDKKQQVLKLLCSEILLDGKNVDISIRKPILALAKIGSCQVWLDERTIF